MFHNNNLDKCVYGGMSTSFWAKFSTEYHDVILESERLCQPVSVCDCLNFGIAKVACCLFESQVKAHWTEA